MKELFSAGVDVTKKCTLRCLHCFNFSGDEKATTCDEELTDKELITMATSILECNPKSMCMCGGEPLLRKDAIMEIANIARDKYPNSSINMVSNGQLITAQVAEDLWKVGFKNIQISLDGASPETVDWIRNKEGMYEAATSALRYLSESRKRLGIDTDICISFCPTKKNLPELEKAIDFCESLDINSFRVQPLMLLGRAKEFLGEYVLSKAEYHDLARRLKNRNSINARSGERLETKWGDPMDHLLIEDVDELRFIQVNAYGDVLFTPYIPIAFGNIRNRSLKEYTEFDWNKVWNHELYKYVRSLMVTPEHMDLSEIAALPSIGYGQVRFDLLDPDWSNKMDDLLIQLQKEHAEVKCFDLKADDYIVKPYSVRVVLKRIEAIFRRVNVGNQQEEDCLVYENLKLDLASRTVYVNGKEVFLTRIEFDIVKYLIRNQGKVCTRYELLSEVWECEYCTGEREVNFHIMNLRKKGIQGIQTVRGIGYKIGK